MNPEDIKLKVKLWISWKGLSFENISRKMVHGREVIIMQFEVFYQMNWIAWIEMKLKFEDFN